MRRATSLERFYRRLMRAYPAVYRREREDEMVAVLLDSSTYPRPTSGEAWNLIRSGLAVRWRLVKSDEIALTGVLVACLFVAAACCLVAQATVLRGQFVEGSTEGIVLPTEFPSWDPLPATVDQQPPGVSVASYLAGDGDWDTQVFQMVVAADGRTVRRIRRDSTNSLSADGRWIATIDERHLVLHSLITHDSTELAFGGDRILAWSHDSRFLLVQRGTHTVQIEFGRRSQQDMGEAGSAAYAFGDDRLALLHDHTLRIVSGDRTDSGAAVWLVEVASGHLTKTSYSGAALGWLTPSTLLVRDISNPAYKRPLESLDVTTGATQLLSSFTARGEVDAVQFATQLTPSLATAPVNRFARGSARPWRWLLGSIALMLLTGFLGAAFTETAPSRSRRRALRLSCKHIAISIGLLIPLTPVGALWVFAVLPVDRLLQLGASLLLAAAAYVTARSTTRSARLSPAADGA